MSHLYNNQSQSPVHSTPLHTGRARSLEEALNVFLCLVRGELSSSTRGHGKGEGPLERVIKTEYTTYKPYEKVTPVPCQYHSVGTPVLTRRYSSTSPLVLQYQLCNIYFGTGKRREE